MARTKQTAVVRQVNDEDKETFRKELQKSRNYDPQKVGQIQGKVQAVRAMKKDPSSSNEQKVRRLVAAEYIKVSNLSVPLFKFTGAETGMYYYLDNGFKLKPLNFSPYNAGNLIRINGNREFNPYIEKRVKGGPAERFHNKLYAGQLFLIDLIVNVYYLKTKELPSTEAYEGFISRVINMPQNQNPPMFNSQHVGIFINTSGQHVIYPSFVEVLNTIVGDPYLNTVTEAMRGVVDNGVLIALKNDPTERMNYYWKPAQKLAADYARKTTDVAQAQALMNYYLALSVILYHYGQKEGLSDEAIAKLGYSVPPMLNNYDLPTEDNILKPDVYNNLLAFVGANLRKMRIYNYQTSLGDGQVGMDMEKLVPGAGDEAFTKRIPKRKRLGEEKTRNLD